MGDDSSKATTNWRDERCFGYQYMTSDEAASYPDIANALLENSSAHGLPTLYRAQGRPNLNTATHDIASFIFTRDSSICYSAYMPRQFRPSVCLSVTRVYCIKTAERIIEILSPPDRPITLVFRQQGSLRKSDGVTPNGGAKYKGVAILDQYAAISRKR